MNRKRAWLIFGVFILSLGLLAACGHGEATDGSGTAEENGNTEQNSGDNEASGEELSGSLTVTGSSAMQPLIEEAANQFMQKNPGVQITVQGGGSGTGLADAESGNADIGNSDVFAEEKGIDPTKVIDHKAFVVGMGPVAHPEVGIDDISQEDLIKVFSGEITNWRELGGADQDIILVNRPESSGTRATFHTWALNGTDEYRGGEGIEQDSSGTVHQIIGETPGAIGYLAFSYYDDTVLPLKLDGVEPTDENVYTNDWYVWAYQHMYTNADGENEQLEQAFIDFVMSDEIQSTLIPEMGYIPSAEMKVERDAEGNVTDI